MKDLTQEIYLCPKVESIVVYIKLQKMQYFPSSWASASLPNLSIYCCLAKNANLELEFS